jgi:sigma-B regulation protein RsbU (phosphoserine phosphatase)
MRRLPRPQKNAQLARLARETSLPELAPLACGIFALFALLGLIIDIINGGRMAPAVVVINSLLSGLVAVAYAFSGMRRAWGVFWGTAVFQTLWLVVVVRGNALPSGPRVNGVHLQADAIGVLVLMIIAYTAFLAFINGTASQYLRVRAEIDLAHEIHQVLVPGISGTLGADEFTGVSVASGEVGGDLVDVVTLEDGWFGYVADVSGHGVSSGLVMGMFKSALRMRLRQAGLLAELMTDLNTVLYPLKSGSMFVTLACIRSCGRDTLDFAVAGHLPILRVRAGAVDEITTPQVPIAMFESYPFTSSTVNVQSGDLLALLTDGLIEVFDEHDRDFGLERMKSLLAGTAGRPLAEIAECLFGAARAHGKQLDDQTLLLIRRT